MRLSELEMFNPITIQCHDNPDADSIGSGYALYSYFKSKGKDVTLLYSGRFQIQKSNLKLMIEELRIPIEYIEQTHQPIKGLLITVDCQYGAGNVKRLIADHVAIIDHHFMEEPDIELYEIDAGLGSCATLVWQMLLEEGYPIEENEKVGTALYYALYADTNQFSEAFNPLDMDMRDSLHYNKNMVHLFKNSNISLKELETAGRALMRTVYNEEYRYAMIKAEPCDPNILGVISDFLLQVDGVSACIVYNELEDRIKLSVRSCVKEVRASELAAFLCEGIGSGGGHEEKAGASIRNKLYRKQYGSLLPGIYFNEKMNSYFRDTTVIYAGETDINIVDMQVFRKKHLVEGYIKIEDLFPPKTPITVRTLHGDTDLTVTDQQIILVISNGEIQTVKLDDFKQSYQMTEDPYTAADMVSRVHYHPTVINRMDGTSLKLLDYAKKCYSLNEETILAKPITAPTKLFPIWDTEKYFLGRPGDFLAVHLENKQDAFIVEKHIFTIIYEGK